jgi:hypothetical protein
LSDVFQEDILTAIFLRLGTIAMRPPLRTTRHCVLLLVAVLAWLLPHGQARAAPPREVTVVTRPATPLGTTGMTVNGTIHPRGLPTTWYFEYGPTAEYGQKTPSAPLPPRLAAHYRESWDENTGGWYAGRGAPADLTHHATGGAEGGFVRYTEPTFDDHNHDNGIGTVHLAQYLYPGPWGKVVHKPSAWLAAGDPDLRDARVSLYLRGHNWVPNGTQLQWWTQSQKNIEVLNGPTTHMANWAYTGIDLADHLRSGKWERVAYRLSNDTEQWTYTGGTGHYKYWSINDAQAHQNADFFHMVTFVDVKNPPRGSIDFDEFELTYHNASLLLPSSGGKLLRWPESADDPATLTDGWRHGKGRTWRSAANPGAALAFVYGFKDPVTVRAVQIHQNPEWPAKDVEVLVSADDRTYTPLVKQVLPEKGVPNANFAFTLDTGLSAKAHFLQVRVTSGYRKEHWGLGEIEVFGSGATMAPEDDVNHVNLDVTGLRSGTTYHYRLVATSAAGTTRGADQTYTVPADEKPHVVTGPADHVSADGARILGRLTPLGLPTEFYFEYGLDTKYGGKTPVSAGGIQIVPRTVFAHLTGLKAGATYHYRLAAVNAKGTSFGRDAVFTTAR